MRDERELHRPLVLVVDDDPGVSMALERSIKYLGYRVRVARDGAAGLEEALRTDPAVVLTDINMPGMDGHALLRRLVSAGTRAGIILMSGRGELDDAIGALREGAVDYLKKPWRSEELAGALERATALHDAYRDLGRPSADGDFAQPVATDAPMGDTIDAVALVERLAAGAARGDLDEPPLAEGLAELRLLAGDPDARPEPVAILIDRSPQLARALRVQPRSGGVDEALDRLGIVGVWSAIETRLLREQFPLPVPALQTLNDRVWRFAMARALAMRNIAETSELERPLKREECYLAGLWLDVGASYLLSQIALAVERQGGARVADPAAMTAAIDTHHGAVGAALIERWVDEPDLVSLVREHHAGPRAGRASALWCAAALGGAVAVRLTGFGDPTGERDQGTETLARCAYTLGVGDTALRRLTQSLQDEVHRTGNA